jgi:hypothetical protein
MLSEGEERTARLRRHLFSDGNGLVCINSVAERSKTPTSKFIIVSIAAARTVSDVTVFHSERSNAQPESLGRWNRKSRTWRFHQDRAATKSEFRFRLFVSENGTYSG